MATNFDSYLHAFRKENYLGERLEMTTTREFKDLNQEKTSKSWNHDIVSLYTGGATWAELYEDKDYKGRVLRIGPGTTITNLDKIKVEGKSFKDRIASMRIYDEQPAGWPGPTVPDRRHYVVSNLRAESTNRKIEDLTTTIVKMVPTVGKVLSAIIDVVWPSKKSTWEQMERWARRMLDDVITQVTNDVDWNRIEALHSVMRICQTSPTEDNFREVYTQVLALQPYFIKHAAPASGLANITVFGTMALAIHRLAYFNYDDIFLSAPSEADRATRGEMLNEAIEGFRDSVRAGFDEARAKRLAQVWDHNNSNFWSSHWRVQDDYTGWQDGFDPWKVDIGYSASTTNGLSGKDTAIQLGAGTRDYYRQYAGRSFDADFDVFLEVADLWSYFNLPPDKIKLATEWRPSEFGLWGGVHWADGAPYWYDEGATDHFLRVPRGGKVTGITLFGDKSDSWVEGVEIDVDGKSAAAFGKQGKTSVSLKLERPEEQFTTIFGSAGDDHIDNVTLRSQALDGDGKPTAWPKHAGNSLGKDGGRPFSMSGSDGARGELAGLFFQSRTKSKKLVALGSIWGRERVLPSGG